MKRYAVRVLRGYPLSFSIQAEDSREAHFEAIKHLVFEVMHGFVPLDISEVEELYRCDTCTLYFPSSELKDMEGKEVCGQCEVYATGDTPDWW